MSDQPEGENKGATPIEGESAGNDAVSPELAIEPPQAAEEPSASVEPPASVEPSASVEPPASVEPSASVEPPASEEPSASVEPPASEEAPDVLLVENDTAYNTAPDSAEESPQAAEEPPVPVEEPEVVPLVEDDTAHSNIEPDSAEEPSPESLEQPPEVEPLSVDDETRAEPLALASPPVENVDVEQVDAQNTEEPVPGDVAGSPEEASGDAQPASETPDEPVLVSSQDQAARRESGAETMVEPEGNEAVQEEAIKRSVSKLGEGGEGAGEAGVPSTPVSRRTTTESELQALTTTDVMDRLQKSYDKACRTLKVISNIQRQESVLKLEDHKMELIKKFKTFEGHLEKLGLVMEKSAQTLECKSAPSENIPTPQDILPQVIICGRQEQVPKIIVCDSYKNNYKKSPEQLENEKLLKTQKELKHICEFMNEKLIFKETIIENLHKQIYELQKENSLLRRQLANMPKSPDISQNVLLAHCPMHCKNVSETNSEEPSTCDSMVAHEDSTSRKTQSDDTSCLNVEPGNICSPKCPNFKAVVPMADSRRSSTQDSKTSGTVSENKSDGSAKHVCPPRCPYYKGNEDSRKSSKENSKTSSIGADDQSEISVQHACPQTCPCLNANEGSRRSSKEDSKSVISDGSEKHVCPSTCSCLKANTDSHSSSKQDSKTSSICLDNQLDVHICPPRCPYFKPNLPVVKEESEISQPCNVCNVKQMVVTEQHVCTMSCPYFKESLRVVKEEPQHTQQSRICKEKQAEGPSKCVCPSKFQSAGNNNELEKFEVEICEHNLCSVTDNVPNDECMEGDVTDATIVMRLCKDNKPKQLSFCELMNDYTCLKMDFNNRMVELEALRKDIVKHKEIAEHACVAQQRAEIQAKNISDKLKTMQDKTLMMMVPKEQMMEMEQQIVVAKERFLESQDELEELRDLTQRQTIQLDDYRNKYLASHEQVEDQKGQIDMLEMENGRISENVALEIQHVKNQFEVRLQALAPLPDVLKSTQEKLLELQQQQEVNERKYADMENELQKTQDKMREYAKQLDGSVTSSNMELEGQGSTKKKFEKLQSKYRALQEENAALLKTIVDMEQVAANNQIRLTEKLHEVAQLAATLEMLRVESARQVSRAKERLDSVRDALQAQIVELEQQVAESRAIARTARKDRENIRQRMQCQINSLHESFEQAQITIQTLQEQIGFFNETK